MIRFAIVVVVATACRGAGPAASRGTPDELAAYLTTVVAADEPARRHELATWILDEATWRATVVPTYAELQPEYARAFDAALAPIAAQLARGGHVTARRHYAGDPRLTRGQARLRWALPVQYPSAVAELDGVAIDTVFVFDGARWRALAGLDAIVLARVREQDAACADRLARAGPTSHCTEVGWAIADSALRLDRAGFDHACALAENLCANEAQGLQ